MKVVNQSNNGEQFMTYKGVYIDDAGIFISIARVIVDN